MPGSDQRGVLGPHDFIYSDWTCIIMCAAASATRGHQPNHAVCDLRVKYPCKPVVMLPRRNLS